MRARNSGFAGSMIALAIVTATAQAASDLQQIRAGSAATVYIYPETVERGPDFATVWSLWDHSAEQLNLFEEPYRSARLHSEYDCKDRTVRLLEIVEFEGAMAKGAQVRSYPASDSQPRPVPAGTVGDDILQQVCAKPAKVRDF